MNASRGDSIALIERSFIGRLLANSSCFRVFEAIFPANLACRMARAVHALCGGTPMDSGYYAACTALVSRTQALDTIANNLANASTAGFRAEKTYSAPYSRTRAESSSSALNQAINNFGVLGRDLAGRNPGRTAKDR